MYCEVEDFVVRLDDIFKKNRYVEYPLRLVPVGTSWLQIQQIDYFGHVVSKHHKVYYTTKTLNDIHYKFNVAKREFGCY